MQTNLSGTIEEAHLRKTIAEVPQKDQAFLQRAIAFAVKKHQGQTRHSGEPYVIHPLAVAERLHQKYHDSILTAAALLHDTIEDCPDIRVEDIYEQFGDEVGFLVDAVTKRRNSLYRHPNIRIYDRIERVLYAGQKDIRVLLLKIADRENNLKTINNLKQKKQIRMAFETQAVYQPLKRILGYDQGFSVAEARTGLENYEADLGLHTAQELKASLFSESFQNLDSDLFGLIYNDTESIVWKINDFETYKRVSDAPSLAGIVQFLSIQGNRNWFQATFQFLRGAVITDEVKLGISSYQG